MPLKITFNIIFLPTVLFIGCMTSYEDLLSSKIRNKWIFTGLIYSIIIYLLSWILYSLYAKEVISPIIGRIVSYLVWNFDKWCINLAISTLVAYFLWHFKMWAAGDAKLFITYSALIPMGQYSKVYFNYHFASFLLLLAIFIPPTIFIFLKAFFYAIEKNNFKENIEKLKKSIKEGSSNIKNNETFKILFGFFCIFLFFLIIRKEFSSLMKRFLPDQNILTMVLLLVFNPISKFFKNQRKIVIFIFIFLSVYVILKFKNLGIQPILLIVNTLGRSILVMVLFPIVNKIINIYSDSTIHKHTPFAIWMFIGALITWFI